MAVEVHPEGKTEGTEEVQKLLQEGLKETLLKYEVIYSDLQWLS